jgi:hypothetical protein
MRRSLYATRDFAEAGGLINYGADITKPIARKAFMPDESSKAQSRLICQ